MEKNGTKATVKICHNNYSQLQFLFFAKEVLFNGQGKYVSYSSATNFKPWEIKIPRIVSKMGLEHHKITVIFC